MKIDKMKRGEITWDKLGKWILLLIFLVLILLLVFSQKDKFMEAVESIKIAFRFGG
tara:strand:+ start:1639 stop:1806 length:168 start_codon:yes stop_codon:yes gene_type:complete